VDGVSSLTGGHTDVKASKENCGACSLNNDRADSLEEEVKGSTARIGHVESADPDGCVDVKKESFMAVDDLPQEFEGEQAGATLEDLFFFNGEEEDDSDWEPASRLVENRWFCFNCTMPIVDEITYCMVRLIFDGQASSVTYEKLQILFSTYYCFDSSSLVLVLIF
jgi:histone deacetylase 6